MSKDKMQNEIRYQLSKELLTRMLFRNLITEEEYNQMNSLNLQTFQPAEAKLYEKNSRYFQNHENIYYYTNYKVFWTSFKFLSILGPIPEKDINLSGAQFFNSSYVDIPARLKALYSFFEIFLSYTKISKSQ